MKAHDIATMSPWVPNMAECVCVSVCVHMRASEYLIKENVASIDSQDFDL